MTSTQRMSRISDASDDENENEMNIMPAKRNNMKFMTKMLLIFVIISLVIIVLAVSVFMSTRSAGNGGDINKNDAVTIIDGLFEVNESYSNFTDYEQSKYEHAFNVFDQDNDNYLNRTEFANFWQLELNRSEIFDKIDANKDGILSFVEVVTYMNEINKMEQVHERMVKMIGDAIKSEYGFEYNYFNNTNISLHDKQLFIQYAALFMYFKPFDLDSNGYIRSDEYFMRASEMEFNGTDYDNDNKISLNELGQVFYGEGDNSWNGIAHQIYGDNYKEIVIELNKIRITQQEVKEMNNKLEICPLIGINNFVSNEESEGNRRRLITYYYGPTYYKCCKWYYISSRLVYICKTYYCYSGYKCWCT